MDPAVLEPILGPLVLALALVSVVLLVLVVSLGRRVARLDARLAGLTRGEDGRSLEAILEAHLGRVHGVTRDVEQLAGRATALEAAQRRAFQRVGLVRYNPFEDTGGNQSFALALLDAAGDGFAMSSLHARSGTRVYAKAIVGGRAESALSDEEAEALRLALGRPGETPRG